MDIAFLNSKFARMGARLKLAEPRRRRRNASSLSIDIGSDRRGEFFEIARPANADPVVEVLDVQPRERHLLLLVREDDAKSKFLCGHDERHWFVAGIPESAPVGTVQQAMSALQPAEVQVAVARNGVRGKSRNRRKNAAFIRQGEWFFLPLQGLDVEESAILRDEPLSRGIGSKPHRVDFCYRTGGEVVYVCYRYPHGIPVNKYRSIIKNTKGAKNWRWSTMTRNPGVYVQGRVRHPDHATIHLHGWHRVAMNTENQSRAMRHVAFLD